MKENPRSNHSTSAEFSQKGLFFFFFFFSHLNHAFMLGSKSEQHDAISMSSLFSYVMLFPRLQLFILGLRAREGDYII